MFADQALSDLCWGSEYSVHLNEAQHLTSCVNGIIGFGKSTHLGEDHGATNVEWCYDQALKAAKRVELIKCYVTLV